MCESFAAFTTFGCLLFISVSGSPLDAQGPVFIQEPLQRLEFSNARGGHADCQAHGLPHPSSTWTLSDGSPISALQDIRLLPSNGSMVFLPFPAERFRHDVHTAIYRCVARNSIGVILSREMIVRAVVSQKVDVQVYDVYVQRGNTAILRCQVPNYISDFVIVTSWVQDDIINIYPGTETGGKYAVLKTGELFVFNAGPSDGSRSYSCRILNKLTGEVQASNNAARIIINEVSEKKRPLATVEKHSTRQVKVAEDVILPCAAQGFPVPTYRWYKEDKDQLVAIPLGERITEIAPGLLYLAKVRPEDQGKYICWANNSVGEETIVVQLTVTAPLSVYMQPKTQVIDVGKDASFSCIYDGFPVGTVTWFHNGKPIGTNSRVTVQKSPKSERMVLLQIQKEDQGMYQCFISSEWDTAQATTELQLGDASPELLSWFTEQTLQPGPPLSLKCSAVGNPPPQFTWTLDGFPLPDSGRYDLWPNDKLRSVAFFISWGWCTKDGIKKEKRAKKGKKDVGEVDDLDKLTNQVTKKGSLEDRLGNSPDLIEKKSAKKKGAKADGLKQTKLDFMGQYITVNDDVVSHVNISTVKDEDGGEYTCTAKNTVGQISHRARINVYGLPFIRVMPRVSAVAGRSLIIKCPVAGYPIESISWEKDGAALPVNRRQRVFANGTLAIEQVQKQTDSGTYTCQARNKQKYVVRRDVEVQVLVPPKILPIQALKDVFREGMRAVITCTVIEGDVPITFRFEKNGQVILMGHGIAIRRLDEYTSSLVIENISPHHSGNYTCFAENQAGVEFFTVPLTVNVPPRWHVEPSDAKVAAGKDVIINCQAAGYPQPSITWRKSIGDLPGEYKDFLFVPNANVFPNGSLKFEKISKENEGHYLCESKNGVGTGISKLIQLTVNVPAHFPQKMKQMQVVKGEQAHMQCTAMGDTPIEIVWKIHGHRIHQDIDQRYIVRDHPMEDGVMSEIGISHTYRQDTGVFTCLASNDFGQDEMKTTLIVQEVPESPKNLRVNEQQSQSIQIAWTQPYAGNSPILNYITQYKQAEEEWQHHPHKVVVTGATTIATMTDLKPASTYHVRVIAENRLGRSESSEVLQVTTQEEAPSGPPQEVEAEAVSSSEIRVTWKPPHRDVWNGNLLGYYIGYQEHIAGYQPNPSPTATTNYNFKTVEMGAQYGGEALIQRLNKFTTYSVVLQAFNSRGAGPASEPAVVRTKEDVPSLPPEHIQCKTLSSESLEVLWEPPNPDGQHGILLGFKVTYQSTDIWHESEQQTKVTPSMRTVINKLLKFANYSVTVLAYTSAGDGVKSAPIYCRTDEDVPSPPSDIKAALSSVNKIIVSWLPPKHSNGILISYTFYMSIIEDGKEEGTHKRILPADGEFHETVRLQERATYQFWLTASTRIGEGEPSTVANVPPSNKVPARIMSFSRDVTTPWKQSLNLTCRKVGIPTPQTTWRHNEKVMEKNNRRTVLKDGSLILKDIQKIDHGNYTCSIENTHGKDEITYGITVEVPPDRPKLQVTSATSDSLQLLWEVAETNRNFILGYVINYKRDHGDWEELQIGPKSTSYLLENLWCATRYQLYITAYNNIGTGLPCDIVNAFTKGEASIKPKLNQLLTVNSTSISVWLDTWQDGGCPILYFILEYRSEDISTWALASNNLQPGDRVYSLLGLAPGYKYFIRITAHNNAGSTVAIYNVTTLNPAGVLLAPTEGTPLPSDVPFYYDLNVIITVFVLSTVFTLSVVAAAFIRRKRLIAQELATLGESPSVAQIQNEHNRDQQYLAIGVHDRPHQKSESERIKSEYADEICPYATFQISKPPYQESTYSGNVYSGPYSSVKGSFVYHDSKQTNAETYKLKPYKESEYSKVRRKGGRLRDPHSESQESDNLGSTDSEVKKILSMHLPISEYDTLGSDSEGEGRVLAGTSSQELLSFRHRPRGDLNKSGEDDSSSSTEASQNSGRKSFQPRKAKGKAHSSMKRHVRSSSGYSSHTEETTFSVSSFNSRPGSKLAELIHAHNADTVECDKLHGKRRVSKGNAGRYTRDTSFQIDV